MQLNFFIFNVLLGTNSPVSFVSFKYKCVNVQHKVLSFNMSVISTLFIPSCYMNFFFFIVLLAVRQCEVCIKKEQWIKMKNPILKMYVMINVVKCPTGCVNFRLYSGNTVICTFSINIEPLWPLTFRISFFLAHCLFEFDTPAIRTLW